MTCRTSAPIRKKKQTPNLEKNQELIAALLICLFEGMRRGEIALSNSIERHLASAPLCTQALSRMCGESAPGHRKINRKDLKAVVMA